VADPEISFEPDQAIDFAPDPPPAPTAPPAVAAPPAGLTALRAAHAGVDGAGAAQAIGLSEKTGLAPQFVADNLSAIQEQHAKAAFADHLEAAPVSAAYAAQSPVHAAAVKEDAEHLSVLEYWVTGKWEKSARPVGVGPYNQSRLADEMVAPPVWQSGLAKFAFGLAGGLLRIKKATIGLTAEEQSRLSQDEELGAGAVAGDDGSGVRRAGAAAAETLPYLLTAPASKPAQATAFTLQAFPGYYRALDEATDEHGARRYTDREAKLIASGAALATGVGSAVLGSAFLKAIPGASQRLNGLLGESLVQAFTENPTLAKVAVARLLQATPHMASGIAMMTASGSVNGAVQAIADGHSVFAAEGLAEIGHGAKEGARIGALLSLLALHGAGKRFAGDLERIRAAAGPEVVAPEGGTGTAPLMLDTGDGPIVETTATPAEPLSGGELLVQDLGRATDSATESAQLENMVSAAQKTGLVKAAPAEAQRLFAAMAQQGQHDTAFIHPVAAQDPDVAAAIDAALEDGGQARALAASTGSTIAVPLEKYLTEIAPDHHDAISDHVKLTPGGMTPHEAREAMPELQKQMASLQEPLTVEKLQAISERGSGAVPTTEEFNAILGELRKLGFDAPDVPAVKVEGLGSEPATRPRKEGPRLDTAIIPAVDMEAAQSVVEAQKIGQIHPGRFELAARQAEDKLAEVATKAAERGISAAERMTPPVDALQDGLPLGDVERANAINAKMDMKGGAAQRGLASVPMLEHNRDFSRAIAKVSDEVASEMRKAFGAVRTLARNTKVRAQLGLADPAFRDVFDSLTEAVGARTPQPSAARLKVDDLLQTLQNRRLPVPFDEVAVREIIEKPRPWTSLTPPEARQITTATASIIKMAKDVNTVAVREQRVGLAEAKARIAAENANRKDLGAPAATRSARSALDVMDAGLGVANAWNLKPETVMQTLGPTMHGVFLRSIEGRNAKLEMQGEILRHFQEHVGELDWMKEKIRGGLTLRMPKLGDAVLAPPPENNAERQGSVSLPRALARKYGSTPAEWENLLSSGKELDDLPAVKEILEKAQAEWAKSRTVQTIPDLADKFNKETLAMAFMNLGTEGNEQRLTSGYNWTGPAVRAEIGKHLTLEQVDQLQSVLSFFEKELWPKIRDHAERTTGIAPPKVQARPVTIHFADGRSKTYEGGYFPASPHPDAIKAEEISKSSEAARATISASFTKTRAAQASYPLDLNWKRVGSHVDSVLHYLAYDEPLRDISKVLDDGGVQSIIRHSVGDANLKNLAEWRDVLAVGRVDNTGIIDQAIRHTLRSRAVTNALSFNLPIALMQASHIPYAVTAGAISATNTALAAGRQVPFTSSWRNLRNELTELQFRSTRWADQYRDAISGERALLGGEIRRGLDHVAFLHMEAADAIVSHIIGDAALNDALDKNMSREDAREYANAKIRLLMPSHNVFEMAPISRSPGLMGALSLFRGLPNVVWNVNYGLFDRARQAVHTADQPRLAALPDGTVQMEEAPDGTWGMKASATGSSAVRWLASGAVLSALGFFLAGHGKDEEDGSGKKGWAKWALRKSVGSVLEQMPGARDLGQPFIDAAVKGKSIDWAVRELKSGKSTPELQAVFDITDQLGKLASRSSTTPQRMSGAVNASLSFMGVGVKPITAAATNVASGNPHMRRPRGGFDRASQIVYPTRTREKTPLNLMQDLISGTE
jgi:hypothetical protein